MSSFKFIGAADLHIDSPLSGLSSYEGAPVEALRNATRSAFSRLVDESIREMVWGMLLSGDLFDGNWKDMNTGLFFVRECNRLRKAGIKVFVLYGNHDAESEVTKQLVLPDNVHVCASNKTSTFAFEDVKIAIHGRSFKNKATTDNLVPSYPPPLPGYFNVGMLHTALEGNSDHATYAPCKLEELVARGYDCWVLGHVHQHQILNEADPLIFFPGNLQGRHAKETGPRGALLVSVDEGRVSQQRVICDVLRWHRLEVDITGRSSWSDVVSAAGAALHLAVADYAEDRPMAVRIVFTGQTPVHGDLFGRESDLRAEMLGQASGVAGEGAWIEKVKVETQPPSASTAMVGDSEALSALGGYLKAAADDPGFLRELQADLQDMVGRVPPEVGALVQDFDLIREGRSDALIPEVAEGLLAQIAGARG